ncbi:hypothetical protein [Streptomyces sp. UH6]|uniref:hypothetical protein n=1 Tax=Streptomyces sp. UH6 TaxID=2748379 RepID=UPI0015D4A827|nr:hypothetical protein [Streptomyces sp. UH6]NYV78026.1 hypothetical protein [Streptomyces sp. UH6]
MTDTGRRGSDRTGDAPLLAHGRTPPRLAAARIHGDEARFTDALDLAARLGPDTSDAIRGSGRL